MVETIEDKHLLNPIHLMLIIILGIIIAVTILMAFFSASGKAADQIRVKDIALIQKFLEAYKKDNGFYPPSIQNKPQNYQAYLEGLPVPPPHASNCTEADNEYNYTSINGGQSYRLSFCLASRSGNFVSGVNILKE